jgi:hypothetical protein
MTLEFYVGFLPSVKLGKTVIPNARPYRFLSYEENEGKLIMKRLPFTLLCGAVLMALAPSAMSHDCRVRDAYLRGAYEGECNERTELAQGKGEAKGADTYVGHFAKGRPDGKGIYIWGAARAWTEASRRARPWPGVYVSTKGVRYEAQFVNGKLGGLKTADCP